MDEPAVFPDLNTESLSQFFGLVCIRNPNFIQFNALLISVSQQVKLKK